LVTRYAAHPADDRGGYARVNGIQHLRTQNLGHPRPSCLSLTKGRKPPSQPGDNLLLAWHDQL
jgi:hypothetical protein